jgi:hypothetical protein
MTKTVNPTKLPFILFFLADAVATPKELAAASKIRGRIGYRNAQYVDPDHGCEPCDGVAGAVPPQYAKKFPSAEKAVKDFDARLEAAAKAADSAAVEASKPAPAPAGGTGAAPAGFDKLPGGDGSQGAPAAPAGEQSQTAPNPPAPAAKPAWGSKPATENK